MSDKYHTKAHFVEIKTGKLIDNLFVQHVPRVGDTCRFAADEYWEVGCVIHIFDEDVPYYRVNIGIRKIK